MEDQFAPLVLGINKLSAPSIKRTFKEQPLYLRRNSLQKYTPHFYKNVQFLPSFGILHCFRYELLIRTFFKDFTLVGHLRKGHFR